MPLSDPWLDIRLVFHNGQIWWSVRPSDLPTHTRIESAKLEWVYEDNFTIPIMLTDWLHQRIGALGEEQGPHATGPITLPVFVNPWDESLIDQGVRPGELLDRVEEIMLDRWGIDPEKLSIALTTSDTARLRRAVELPYRVLASSEVSDGILSQIADANWYDDMVRDYGITLDTFDASNHLARNCEILICSDTGFHDICNEPDKRFSARLYVVLMESGGMMEWTDRLRDLPPPARTSTIWVEASYAIGTEFIRSLVEGIIHDYPLHQALRAALRPIHGSSSTQPALLWSDPIANQHLRMRDIALRMHERILEIYERFDIGPVKDVLESELYLSIPEEEQAMLLAEQASTQLLNELPSYVFEFADFVQESVGLAPRAEAMSTMSVAKTLRREADSRIGEAMTPSVRERMTELQERRVNLKLLRLTPETAEHFTVSSSDTLACDRDYRLRVYIGRRSADNLVIGESPPIDTLLPEPASADGHQLSIVLQPLDFKALNRTLRKLILPPLGPSKSVSFDIRAPNEEGRARVRVLVYLEHSPEDTEKEAPRNHLVQSLLLETKITENGTWDIDNVTTAKVEFSRSHRFANLNALGERALSIAFNLDPDGSNHTLKIKIGDKHCDLEITEARMSNGLKDFRDILQHAVFDDPANLAGAKFLEGEDPAIKEMDFDDAIRRLAGLGSDLWTNVIQSKLRRNEKLRNLVEDFQECSDQKIQIVPLRSTLFPWTSLYDAPLSGGTTNVCRGYRRHDSNGKPYTCAQCLQQCLHTDRSHTVCIYGFWGTRFPIEQLMAGQAQDSVTEVSPVKGRALHLCVGLEHGPASKLPTELSSSVGPDRILEYKHSDLVLDVLWNAKDRPAILLIVGHSEVFIDPQLGRKYPRITLPGNGRWLSPRDISNRLQLSGNQFLMNPSPVVILAACDSASINLSTLMDFIMQFDSVGAAAVIGTETPVVEQFAAAFGKRLANGLFQAESVSEALLAFRREGIIEDNPLGFAITAFGDATLEQSL